MLAFGLERELILRDFNHLLFDRLVHVTAATLFKVIEVKRRRKVTYFLLLWVLIGVYL